MTQSDDTLKIFCLIDEIDTSVKLLKLGLGELQNINGVNDFYFLPFQLLSSGIERLLKCMICIGYHQKRAKFPNSRKIKTHDLLKLKERVLQNYFKKDSPIALKTDFEFLSNDHALEKLLFFLSEFGKYARYRNLDVLTGAKETSIDVKQLWKTYELDLIMNYQSSPIDFLDYEKVDEIKRLVISTMVSSLEKAIRGLSRQFTLGALREKGKQHAGPLFDFLFLMDNDLGNTDYRKSTMRYQAEPKKVHKRSKEDELERKNNPEFKSKTIFKHEYEGQWPFFSDEVIIECRQKHWCIITIDSNDYALNGSASRRYKLENVFEAGMAKQGMSVGPFIDMALELGKCPL